MIKFSQVTKSYGDVRVLNNIDISIDAGQTTALVGESGSGKSTLLRVVNGLVRPESGEVSVFGTSLDYTHLPAMRRKMGYAVQGAGLFPHMTVFQNVTLLASLEGWTPEKIQTRYQHLLDLLNLDPIFSDRYPHSLSGGQQQRVSLCRAMMLIPALMLLDEPFSALDPITRDGIHEEFLTLKKAEPRTILLVTHDMSEAAKLSEVVIILQQGEVVQVGSIEQVQRAPVNAYVDQLLTSGPSL